MNPSEPTPKKGLTCRECGADNPPDALECWLCLRSDWRPDAADRPAPATAPLGAGQWVAWIVVLIALAVVLAGIAIREPQAVSGAAVVFGISVTLAWVITKLITKNKNRSAFQSMLMTLVLICLVPIFAFSVLFALFITCFTLLVPPTHL